MAGPTTQTDRDGVMESSQAASNVAAAAPSQEEETQAYQRPPERFEYTRPVNVARGPALPGEYPFDEEAESIDAAPARFKMHRVPSDVLKLITQLLDVKELGRCACTSSVLAAAAVSGFEARARERGPGLVHHAKRASSKPDWRKLCRKAMSFNRQQPPAPRRLEAVNARSALNRSDKTFTFTIEVFDGAPADPTTRCLSAVQAQLEVSSDKSVSVNACLPLSVERARIAFLRVLVSRPKTGDAAVLYSGAATGDETSAGSARWFKKYKPPWIELDAVANADETDDDDEVAVTGNGMIALVWKLMPGEDENDPACGAYFKKCMNLDGAAGGETFMPLNEVLFRLEHLLVFD